MVHLRHGRSRTQAVVPPDLVGDSLHILSNARDLLSDRPLPADIEGDAVLVDELLRLAIRKVSRREKSAILDVVIFFSASKRGGNKYLRYYRPFW